MSHRRLTPLRRGAAVIAGLVLAGSAALGASAGTATNQRYLVVFAGTYALDGTYALGGDYALNHQYALEPRPGSRRHRHDRPLEADRGHGRRVRRTASSTR